MIPMNQKCFINDKGIISGYDDGTNLVKDKGSDDMTWMMIWQI